MDTHKLCQSCQAPLAADAPRGLCPACLMKVAMATGTVAREARPGFTPPGIEELARKFPQLEIIELIGRGGMGAVYKARQKELDRIVALKILPPGIGDDAAFAERFAREAKAMARLNHPGIVTIHDFGRADGLYFFVMEFVDGVNLRQLLASSRVSPREALAIVPQICDALQFAHDQGIVHRDIKPENILLDRRGRVKVADFGLAKLTGADALTPSLSHPMGEGGPPAPGEGTPVLTEAGRVMGTPAYMAPEQVEHPADVDHRADIYALGVVFYQMLTGELPGKRIEPPSKKVQIDVRLDEVVLRALEKKPELRYQQVSEVKTMVETIVGSPGPSAGRGEKAQTEAATPRQSWWTWSPLQSQEAGEICSHLTRAERNHLSVLGLVSSAWIVGTCFGIPAFIRSNSGSGKWIVASVWVILFAVSIPMLQRMVRHFLCSTAWARERAFAPEHLRLFSFSRGNRWKVCAFLAVGLVLIFAQSRLFTHLSGLSELSASLKEDAARTAARLARPQRNSKQTTSERSSPGFTDWSFCRIAPREGLELKTGKLAPMPQTVFAGDNPDTDDAAQGSAGFDFKRATDWAKQEGVDLCAEDSTNHPPGFVRLAGFGMKVIPLSREDWNDMTSPQLMDELRLATPLTKETGAPGCVLFGSYDLPATFGFATRDGGLGVLQITGFTTDPRCVMIRYKLARDAKAHVPLAPAAERPEPTFGPAYGHEQEFRQQLAESVPMKEYGYTIKELMFSDDYRKALVVFTHTNNQPGLDNSHRRPDWEFTLESHGFRRYQGMQMQPFYTPGTANTPPVYIAVDLPGK